MKTEKVGFVEWLSEFIKTSGLKGVFEKDALQSFHKNVNKDEVGFIFNLDAFIEEIETYCFLNGIGFEIEKKHLPTEYIDKCMVKFTAYYFYL